MLRHFAIWAFLGVPLMAADLKVDHATVCGHDLGAMQRAFDAMGLPHEYGGPHANHATEMALVSFPDGSYLELMGIQPHADAAALARHEWHKFLESDGGPCAWAIRPADLTAEAARLRTAGIMVSSPARNGRKRPDGVQLEWEAAQVGTGNGNFFPFLIHDFTPRDRRAYPTGKPTAAQFSGVAKVVLAVNDLDAAIAQYQHAYGLPAPQRQDDANLGARLAWFAGTPVVLAAPAFPNSWLAERIRRYGEAPCAFVLGGAKTAKASSGNVVTEWFGKQVAWLSPEILGWRLGLE